jgi:hypothetical protein
MLMAAYIDANTGLVQDPPVGFTRVCPHCCAFSHLTVVAVPPFAVLEVSRPLQVGIVCHCDACHSPVFLRLPVKLYGRQRIELAAIVEEAVKAPEPLDAEFLPKTVEHLCREAFAVYTCGCLTAFALMCRRIMQEMSQDLGEHGRLKLFEHLNDWRELADIDADTFSTLRRVLAGTEAYAVTPPAWPDLDGESAGILLEALKDLLYQSYTRRGRVQAALRARRRSREPNAGATITPLNRLGS